jgi:3-deoxy-manno-octulosonate cytidylyltransferase (CMP-KDO synthetase)
MSTAAHQIDSLNDFENPNIVKVVMDKVGRALYFSRAAIPFGQPFYLSQAWRHIGIYAYRAKFLRQYSCLYASELEKFESLEQLRVLDNGGEIIVQKVDYACGIGVDTQEDLEQVKDLLKRQ